MYQKNIFLSQFTMAGILIDDMADDSKYRSKKICWHRLENNAKILQNDLFMLYTTTNSILWEQFGKTLSYEQIFPLLNKVDYPQIVGFWSIIMDSLLTARFNLAALHNSKFCRNIGLLDKKVEAKFGSWRILYYFCQIERYLRIRDANQNSFMHGKLLKNTDLISLGLGKGGREYRSLVMFYFEYLPVLLSEGKWIVTFLSQADHST